MTLDPFDRQTKLSEPYGWLQWKGSCVYVTLFCDCGEIFAIKDEFLYNVMCLHCKNIWNLNGNIEFIKLNDYEKDRLINFYKNAPGDITNFVNSILIGNRSKFKINGQYAEIDWNITDSICMDMYCSECKEHTHLDVDNPKCYVYCEKCNAYFILNPKIELIKLTLEEKEEIKKGGHYRIPGQRQISESKLEQLTAALINSGYIVGQKITVDKDDPTLININTIAVQSENYLPEGYTKIQM